MPTVRITPAIASAIRMITVYSMRLTSSVPSPTWITPTTAPPIERSVRTGTPGHPAGSPHD
jgi:hypothetical protein